MACNSVCLHVCFRQRFQNAGLSKGGEHFRVLVSRRVQDTLEDKFHVFSQMHVHFPTHCDNTACSSVSHTFYFSFLCLVYSVDIGGIGQQRSRNVPFGGIFGFTPRDMVEPEFAVDGSGKLIFFSLRNRHSGRYICIARNPQSIAVQCVHINVTGEGTLLSAR